MMTKAERAAAAHQRQEELVEILTNAVLDLALGDHGQRSPPPAAARSRQGRAG
jgi:hypothetical protein